MCMITLWVLLQTKMFGICWPRRTHIICLIICTTLAITSGDNIMSPKWPIVKIRNHLIVINVTNKCKNVADGNNGKATNDDDVWWCAYNEKYFGVENLILSTMYITHSVRNVFSSCLSSWTLERCACRVWHFKSENLVLIGRGHKHDLWPYK